jgi:hypothetical protein
MDASEAEVPEQVAEEPTGPYPVALPKEVQTAIKQHQWQKVWSLMERGRATLGKAKAHESNDFGPINAVLLWDYPCPQCGTKAFVNRRSGLICVACRKGHKGE